AVREWAREPVRGHAGLDRDLPRLACVPGRARARSGRRRPHRARAQALVRRALRRGLRAAGAADRGQGPGPVRGARRPGRARRGRGRDAARRVRHCERPDRPPADVCARHHGGRRRLDARLPGGPLMLTTALIVLPLAGAILVWILPLSRESTSGLALLVALAEVGLWLGSARNFDFGSDAPQYATTREWFDQLGISYSVGLYGFQFWL